MKLIDGEKLIAELRRYGHETISVDGLEGLIDVMENVHESCKDADSISRKAAIDALRDEFKRTPTNAIRAMDAVKQLPSAQPESCEYYALCRHGRDENKLRVRLGFCEYCNEDSNGYVKPIEKNNHAFVRFGTNGWELSLKANGWHGSAKIRFCPMCGRDLYVK